MASSPRLAEHAVAGVESTISTARTPSSSSQSSIVSLPRSGSPTAGRRSRTAALGGGGQGDLDRRALARLGSTRTFPARLRDRAVHRRQPEPGPLAHRLGRVERLEDCGSASGAIPTPVSVDRRGDERARRRGSRSAAARHRASRPGVDREVHDHLFELPASARTRGSGSSRAQLDLDVLADQPPSIGAMSAHDLVRGRARLGLEDLLAAEGEQLAGERRGALAGALGSRRARGRAGRRRRAAREQLAVARGSRVSRLLKSCAMPPASWPIASIFCAWRSCSSSARRSVMSRAISEMPAVLARGVGDHRHRRPRLGFSVPLRCYMRHLGVDSSRWGPAARGFWPCSPRREGGDDQLVERAPSASARGKP